MLNKLKEIDDNSTMDIFCNYHSSIPYDNIDDQIKIEKQIFEKCYYNDYYSAITNNYSFDKVIDLYKKSKDEFFLQAYIYSANATLNYSLAYKFYNTLKTKSINILKMKDYKIIGNILITLRLNTDYKEVLSLTIGKSDTYSLFERGMALTRLNHLNEALSLYKELEKTELDSNEWLRLSFRFAEIAYIQKNHKSLKKHMKYLEENYYLDLEEINCRAYYLYKYHKELSNFDLALLYLKKSASVNTCHEMNLYFKLLAIKELRDNYKIYIHRSFEEDYDSREYIELKTQYISHKNNKSYTFLEN